MTISTTEPMLSTVLRRLDGVKGGWPEVAKESGVPYQTLTKIACRIVADPRISTVQTLFDYFATKSESQSMSQSPTASIDCCLDIAQDQAAAHEIRYY